MPKKTKRQKSKALKRRQKQLSTFATVHMEPRQAQASLEYSLNKSSKTPNAQHKQSQAVLIDPAELSAIQKDIGKSILLALVAIGVEISLYFVLK